MKTMTRSLIMSATMGAALLLTACGGNPADGTYKAKYTGAIIEVDGNSIRMWQGAKDGDPIKEMTADRIEIAERGDGSPKAIKFYDDNDQEFASLNVSKDGKVSVPFVPGALERVE